MSVNAMKRLTVIAPAKDTDLLLRRLMHLGCVELTERPADEQELLTHTAPKTDKAAINAQLDRVKKVLPVLAARRGKHRRTRAAIDYSTFLASEVAGRAEKTVTETEKLLDFTAQINEKIKDEQDLMQSLLPYLDFPYPLNELGTQKTKLLLGRLPSDKSAAMLADAADTVGFVAEVISTDKSGTYVAVITHRDTEQEARDTLARFDFAEAQFAQTAGKAVAIFDGAHKRTAKYENDLKHAQTRLNVLAENYDEVCALFDVLQANAQTAALQEQLISLGSCTVLTAWCPAFEEARIACLLDTVTVAYEFSDPLLTEKPPRPAAEPPYTGKGASLLAVFHTPWHGKWHAALPLTVFYALFFGLLFADVGIGLIALLIALGLTLPKRVPTVLKRAALLLGCCGVAQLLFGILLGRYFDSTLLTLLQKNDPAASLIPIQPLANVLNACREKLQDHRILLAVSLFPAATYLLTVFTLRTVFLVRAHRAAEIPLALGPHLCLFTGLALFWLHPIVAACVLAAALLFICVMGIMAGSAKKDRLVAIGGSLLDLLSELTLALCAARTVVVAIIGTLCLWPVSLLAPDSNHAPALLAAALVTFAAAHALNLLLNAAPALVGRAKLCYMAHFHEYYPGRAVLHRPITSKSRYTHDTSLIPDTPVPFPTEDPEEDAAPIAAAPLNEQ